MSNVAVAYGKAGRLGEAVPLLEEAVELSTTALGQDHPDTVQYTRLLAQTYERAGRFAEAHASYRKAAETGHPNALNEFAWLLATSKDPAVRDGRSAVEYAEKAVAATYRQHPDVIDTLAAAYAEAGEFPKAIGAQKEAMALLKDEKRREDFASRLKLYESNMPYRQP